MEVGWGCGEGEVSELGGVWYGMGCDWGRWAGGYKKKDHVARTRMKEI